MERLLTNLFSFSAKINKCDKNIFLQKNNHSALYEEV